MFKIFLNIIFIITALNKSYGYIFSKSSSGHNLKWHGNKAANLTLQHHQNCSISGNYSERSLAASSAEQWGQAPGVNIHISNPYQSINEGNHLYCTSDSTYFSSAVLAVTVSEYYLSNGELIRANILVNSNKSFSSDPGTSMPGDSLFNIGDIFTHEMGHFIGMGHNPGNRSSMFYTASKGQRTIDEDDKAGIVGLYPSSSGSILGRVIGGENRVPIFGAHVSAINHFTGKVSASAFSNEDGSFAIYGLPQGNYYIYTKPGNLISRFSPTSSPLPTYYTTAKSNFCSGGRDYVGSFYQSCNDAERGLPTPVNVNMNSNISIGDVAIKCSREIHPVASAKQTASQLIDLNDLVPGRVMYDAQSNKAGEALVGSFSSAQINNSESVTYEIDLTSYQEINDGNKYFFINFISSSLFSTARVKIEIEDAIGTKWNPVYIDADEDNVLDDGIKSEDSGGHYVLDQNVRIPLSVDATRNHLLVTLTPIPIYDRLQFTPNYLRDDFFFSGGSRLKESQVFYLLSMGIAERVPVSDTYTQILMKTSAPTSNYQCPGDAHLSYAVSPNITPYVPTNTNTLSQKDVSSALGCGTIAMVGGDDGQFPPWQAILTVLVGFMMTCFSLYILECLQKYLGSCKKLKLR